MLPSLSPPPPFLNGTLTTVHPYIRQSENGLVGFYFYEKLLTQLRPSFPHEIPHSLARHPVKKNYCRVKYNVRPTVNLRASNGKGRSNDYMTGHFVRAFRASTLRLICVHYTPFLTRWSPCGAERWWSVL